MYVNVRFWVTYLQKIEPMYSWIVPAKRLFLEAKLC